MSKNTENKLRVKRKVSKRQIEEYDLSKTLVSLMWDEPFYARVLRSMNKIESTELQTAGVLCQNGEPTMLWNREFFASLQEKERKGVLKHECLHLVFNHTTTRTKEPHIIWNYATDLAINSTIPKDELPKGGLIPGESLPALTKEEMENMTDEDIQNYYKFSNLIKNFEKDKTSEYYFDRLMEDETIQEMIEKSEQEGHGKPGGSILSDLGFDSHDDWGDLSDEEKDMFKEKVKSLLKDASSEADASGWGTISNSMRKEFSTMLSKVIDWKALLKKFCGNKRRAVRTSSVRRLNKKYVGIHPGHKKEYKPVIAIYIDESGSVSDGFLAKIYSEIENLSKRTDFYVYKFDTTVQGEMFWKKGKKMELYREKAGGTDFNAPAKHALKNKKKFDGYIIITDGIAPKPIPARMKRCWILSEKDELEFVKDKSDYLIKVKV